MSSAPVIAFGQQPCGFFPRRFLVAKIRTARRLQAELGGEIVFFYHDSDHDPRETRTILRHRATGEPAVLNFTFSNKLQRKFSPLYLKRVSDEWRAQTAAQLPNYLDHPQIRIFEAAAGTHAADFCLDMYRRLGLLEGVRVVRSSDPALRRDACGIDDFFVDVRYDGEVVRARFDAGEFKLHEGGNAYLSVPPVPYTKEQISPTRDTRLRWMQSVLHCTHYVAGLGEKAYLRPEQAPEITYVVRDAIDHSDEAWTELTL